MSDSPTDFNDAFDGPDDISGTDQFDFFDIVDPHLLALVAVLILGLVVAGGIGWYIGRLRARQQIQRQKREAVEYIYEAIKFRLEDALAANGACVLDKAAALKAEIDSRVGSVMALNGRPGRLMGVLSKTLREKTDPDAETIDLSWGKTETAKIKVPLSSQEHQIAVWNALHVFQKFWNDKKRICTLLEASQDELAGLNLGERLKVFVRTHGRPPEGKGPPDPSAPSGASEKTEEKRAFFTKHKTSAPAPPAPKAKKS